MNASSALNKRPPRQIVLRQSRRGAVAVEFAIVAPVLLAVVLGMIELSHMIESQNLLDIAAREGARFACMDHEGMLQQGETANSKLVDDVKDFLASNGFPRDQVTVKVLDHVDNSKTFNLDDPDNNLKLFDVTITVDYSAVRYSRVNVQANYTLKSTVTFRNGVTTVVE
jgi:Flp pilus assembly protein TadG